VGEGGGEGKRAQETFQAKVKRRLVGGGITELRARGVVVKLSDEHAAT
jgi:hypothetical protein